MQKNKIYLVFVDILGFKSLAEEMANEIISADSVREGFVIKISDKIKECEEEGLLIGVDHKRDDWTLAIESKEKLFFVLSRILKNEKIPLEIGIDIKEYDDGTNLGNEKIFYNNETIEFLKSDIVGKYHRWYKKNYDNKSVKKTFIVTSEKIFKELSFHDQSLCKEISFEKTLFFHLPLKLIERERKISDFLENLGQDRSDFTGAFIDRIFVPPEGFEEIQNNLTNNRIVFITGTLGYGKTYTTLRLLWEYYNRGYTPRWISGQEEVERKEVRNKLANIEAQLEPGCIIYFEDPFGKINYEKRDDLKQRIDHIINTIKNVENVYVIITSRKDVFEKFEKESCSVYEIKEFEKELNILKPSYNSKKRKQIIEKWAIEKGCKWLEINEIKEFIFKSIENDTNLLTPLNIHDFVISTINTTDLAQLKKDMVDYSKTVWKPFAEEIIEFYESGRRDRVLFLAFIFISQKFNVDYIKQKYEKMKEKDFESFETILNEEERVKEVSSAFDSNFFDSEYFQTEDYLEFSHSSYYGSIKYILKHPGCKRIFSEVAANILDSKEDVEGKEEAIEILKEIKNTIAVKSLIKTLNDPNINIRDHSAKALGEIGDIKAVDPLIKTLTDQDPCVRGTAAYSLGKIGDIKAVDPLIKTLTDPDNYVRNEVARALGKLGHSKAITPLIKVIKDHDENVRRQSEIALGKIGEPAIKELINALEDPDEDVKLRVVMTLGEIGNPKAVKPLIQTLSDPNKIVRVASIGALIKIGKPSLKLLLQNLKSSDNKIIEASAVSLGGIGDPKAVKPLIQTLSNSNWKVKIAVIEALSKIGNPSSIKYILVYLKDPNLDVQLKTIDVLGKFGNLEALEPLNNALESENSLVKEAASNALDKIRDQNYNSN